jgi:glycosyltransferase involved in cell wall biosynthesis
MTEHELQEGDHLLRLDPDLLHRFSMVSDRVVVIGNPDSVFVQAPVRYWRSLGIDAVILTARWTGPASVGGDLPVLTAETLAPAWVRRAADGLYPLLDVVDASSLAHDRGRVRRALETWGPDAEAPLIAPPIWDALLIAAAADALEPACVLGHEAFAYGLATSLAAVPRRALFAWGADVLHYAAMSDIAGVLVRQALHGVDYVLTNAQSMDDAMHERFGVPRDRIALVSYGVDRRQFRRAIGERDARIRAAHGIAPGAPVVMNIRRFMPHWGATVAWAAMMAAAKRRPDVHLILLDGAPADAGLSKALEHARASGFANRITTIRGSIALDTVADLMSVADVSLSMVDSLEPVSWSVLQAASCGSAVVVGDQPTYRTECARGLAARLVQPRDVAAISGAILNLLDDDALRARMRADNDRFLTEHHDQHTQMTRLLRIVAGSETAARLLAPFERPATELTR